MMATKFPAEKMATDRLLQDQEMKQLWEMVVDHPFVHELTASKLEHDKFRDYIIQDKILCQTLRSLVCSILADLVEGEDFDDFHGTIAELQGYRQETQLFKEMFDGLKISRADTRAHPTTEAFSNFIMRVSSSGRIEEKLLVLYVVEATYMDWAERAKKASRTPSDKMFAKWQDIHLESNLGNLVKWLKQKLDTLLGERGENLTHHHRFLMKRALQYEVMFWDTAFKPGSSVFPGEFGKQRGAMAGK